MLTKSISPNKPEIKPLTRAELEALQRAYLAANAAACWNSAPYAGQIAAMEAGER